MSSRSQFGGPLDVKLIEIVKENPLLYNPSHLNYSNIELRELTWQKIGEALHKPAAEFAGIQCQVQFGDYHEERHKPGFIENFNEYLPNQYSSSWGIEKKILKEYSSHVGLSELEAKHLYTKTARELPTYGVTFFLVKEKQKGKNKLVPRLLGINADAILRLDENTKEILQQWPLTHVKTYHAGRGETFTLNFGDYTEKEYTVKTRDAFRIRDILEGYIDLIRKRMLANYNQAQTETGYVSMDNITYGQASMVTHVSSGPMKIIEQTYVGPCKIISSEPGQTPSQGTQTGTTHQMVVSELINKQGQGVKGEVPMRKDMGIPFTRRLNRLNSNSVKIVTLLTEPSQAHIEDAKKIIDGMNADMPFVREGVQETVAKQPNEEEKKKLRDQLHELDELLKLLAKNTEPSTANPGEAEEAAKQIADLTTQMYFAMAPETKRRSRIISKSRKSFIDDERTENNLRRASFIAATAGAIHALDTVGDVLDQEYKGPALTPQQVEELENAAIDKLGRINAAIAHYMLAHSDPQNIDYAAAVNSLNTINELTPELAKDGQALASVRDGVDRSELLGDIKDLCAAAKHVCSLSGVEDTEKLQEASAKYADLAGKLVYVFGRGGKKAKARADKENEIVDLAKDVGAKASLLLMSAQALTETAAGEPGAERLDAVGARTATAAKDLLAQAELNAPTIQEPHCQSALTAASEALSSSAQQLGAAWKPLVEPPERHELGEKLHNRTMDLARALDKLRQAYADLEEEEDPFSESDQTATPAKDAPRLKFINTLTRAGGNMQAAQDDLNKPLTAAVSEAEAKEAELRLAQRLAQLNAALAALLGATADRSNPDFATADSAVATINELMPEVVKDSKMATANKDEESRKALLDNIKDLCAVSQNVCASAYGADPEDLNAAVSKYGAASGKLSYVLNRRVSPKKEEQIKGEAAMAVTDAGEVLGGLQDLEEAGVGGRELEAKRAALADALQALLTTAKLTSPSISDPRCQSTLLASIDKVSGAGDDLAESWAPLAADPAHAKRLRALQDALDRLKARLGKIKATCQLPETEEEITQECQMAEVQDVEDGPQQQKKLQFVMTMNGAKGKLAEAQNELNKPTLLAKGADVDKVRNRLSQGLAQLNAAIAALLNATSDSDKPDYEAAEQAANTIAKLMPQVIQDTKTVSAGKDGPSRDAMLAQVKELCDASEGMCASFENGKPEDLNDAVAKLTHASGNLVYVVSPRVNPQKEEKVIALSRDVCGATSELLSGVQQLAGAVGGARGEALDYEGAHVADAAQALLQTAQLTAPSLSSPACQQELLSSVAGLAGAGQQLDAALQPLNADPHHGAQAQALHHAVQQLDKKLDALRDVCQAPDSADSPQKLQFIKTIRGTTEKLGDAQKELCKPMTLGKGVDSAEAQQRLARRLAQLNAAIAALLNATADREKPDYAAAEKAASTIAELMPHVVQDTKTVSASKDGPAHDAMLAQVKELCDASEGMCASFENGQPEDLNDAVAKLTHASGKLVYVVSPRVNPQKEEKVIALSKRVCGATSELLSGVQQLAGAVGGTRGEALDYEGAHVADAAQALLQTAQLTAPSLSSPACQQELLSSVAGLADAGQQLDTALQPLTADPHHGAQAQTLHHAVQQLDKKLDALRDVCQAPDPVDSPLKLQFIKTIRGTTGKLGDAQKELSKPMTPGKGVDSAEAQQRLARGLAQLNAAIAALLNATADREKPDYAAAEKAASTIAELMPHVVQDTKTVSAGKDGPSRDAMLAQVKELCNASEEMCTSFESGKPEDLNDAVAKLTNASGKLVYVVSPRVNPQKEEKVVALSSGVCGATSDLLSGVQHLAGAVGGARGEALDREGAHVADAAQALLQTAQLTAPSLSSPACQQELLSSVDRLAGAGQQLDATLQSLQADPHHGGQAQALHHAVQQLDKELDALRDACKAPESADSPQKLQFIKTMRGTTGRLGDAQKELSKPVMPAKGVDSAEAQQRLARGLAQLNAAIAALLNATADREKPDYAAAEKAASTIAELMPHVVQDTKTVSASKDGPSRDAMLAQIKELCDASEGMCASFENGKPEDLNDAVAKLTNASGKLVYVVGPRVNPQKEEKVIALSSGVCVATSALLSGVQQLAGKVGGTRGEALDREGAHVADAAQALQQTAQLTAPSLSSPACQQELLSSVAGLAGASQQLGVALQPLHADPRHGTQAQALHNALLQLDEELDALRDACQAPDSVDSPQKLQFIKTMQGTTKKLGNAQKELSKPVAPAKGVDSAEAQKRLARGLAQLNAAIAALLNATADREKPDYAAAEKAASTIAELMPHVVQDTKTVSAGKDGPSRDAMLAQVRELCDASEGMCASFENGKPEDLNDAVAKLTNASGKLVYVVSPRVNPQKEEKVIALSSGVCGATSALLSGVQQLAGAVGGARGEALDREGGQVADAAQALLQTAQLTAPSLSSPACKQELLSSVASLAGAGQQLDVALQPLHADPRHGTRAQALHNALLQLNKELDALRDACQAPDLVDSPQKLQFIKTMQGTTKKLGNAQKELSKPAAPAKGVDSAEAQKRLARGLAQLNAAIAALLNATADREKPDYAAAEKAANTIADLMPHVIQDTKTVSASKDEPSRDAMLAQVKELCDASEGMCASFENSNPEDLNDAVAKLTNASGKLVYVVGPRVNPQKEEKVIALSSGVCGATSALLSGVQQLAGAVSGDRGEALDREGAHVADAAQALLQTAQLTAPSLSSPACQQELLSSVAGLAGAGQKLGVALQPLHADPRHGTQVQSLQNALQQLDKELGALRDACQAPETVDSPQKLQFIKTIQGAKGKVAGALKGFDEPASLTKGCDVIRVQNRLSQGLAQLNAAIAALINATADREKPDYAAAQKAATIISNLMPQVIEDAKTVRAATDQPTRVAMVAQIEKLCEANQEICTGFENSNPEVLNDAVAKYTDASGKLVYLVSPKVNPDRENKIIALSSGVCGATSALLSGVQQLAGVVGGARGETLDREGGHVADAAQALLQTAQITAPSMTSPECQKELLSSIDSLSGTGQQLAGCLGPLQDDSQHKQQAQNALHALQRLEGQMNELRKACQESDLPEDPQKLQFIKTLEGARGKWINAQKELKKPPAPARGADVDGIKMRLAQRLAELNAAVATLLSATADRDKPRYADAERSVHKISDLLPQVVQDTKTVSAGKDGPSRDAMLAQVKELCDASERMCASFENGKPEDLVAAVAKYTDSSGKLVYATSAAANPQKEEEIITLSSGVCGATSELLSGVQQLAGAVGGEQGDALDREGGHVADAAQALLQTAQITAPSMTSPQCQEALISLVDSLSSAGQQLSSTLDKLHNDSKHDQRARQLNQALQQLQSQLDALKRACKTHAAPEPANPAPPLPTTRPPVAHAIRKRSSADITQDFLDRVRCEESMAQSPHQPPPSPKPTGVCPAVGTKVEKVKPPPPVRKTDDDKRLHQMFVATIQEAEKSIKESEAGLMKLCKSESSSGPALSQSEMMKKQHQLQHSLALAGVEVANLVAANYVDKIDYTAASKSTKALPQIINRIIEDGTQLSDNVNDMARKAFLYDMLQMCEASRKLYDTAKSDRQKLNEAAVNFGDTSTKLLYVVSSDVDPAVEKEVISRAKAIGDTASRLALDATEVAAGGDARGVCDAGMACAEAAGKLVYTAKLTAPTIQEPRCQAALVSSTDTLSTKLKTFADSWKPLASDPQKAKTVSELSKEVANLERILEGLRGDVRGGLGRRREQEHLLVENTPLRELTVRILDGAKSFAESPELQTGGKIEYAAYADRLRDALRVLDLAAARCKKSPHDTNKRRELENAIQNLQMTLLQTRPKRGDKGESNIVDLRDFIEELSSEAKNMRGACDVTVPTAHDKKALEDIKRKCDQIDTAVCNVMTADEGSGMECTFGDILEVDQLGQECDELIKKIDADVKGIEDAKAKRQLLPKMLPLTESCNMLRFATKSGVSASACATLDSSLEDLDDIESRVIASIVRDAETKAVTLRSKPPLPSGDSPATIALCREVASPSAGVSARVVTAYIADAAARTDTANPDEKNKLLKHLYKLVHLLRTLAATSSKRAASWQTLDGPDVATLTEQIIQEMYNPESKFGVKAGETKHKILNESDIAKLLIPAAPKILGDKKQQEDKLVQLSSKLSSMCGLVSQGVTSPGALARSAHAAADAAMELDGIARGVHITDNIQKKNIDQTAKEMSFATYNVLKTAESACQDPNNSIIRRKLVTACAKLNKSIDKLVSNASTATPLSQSVGALSRDAALQLSCLAPRACAPAPFTDTCDLLNKQADNINKLKSDEPMPRAEFMRNLDDIGSAVRTSTECASQCAYFIALSEKHKDIAKTGLVDVPQIQKSIESIQDSCMAIIGASQLEQAKEQKEDLHRRVQDLSGALDKAHMLVKDGEVKRTLVRARSCVSDAASDLEDDLVDDGDMNKITPKAVSLLEAVNQAHCMIEKCPLVPMVGDMSPDTKARCDEVMGHSKTLLSNTLALLKDVNSTPEEEETLTWVTYSTSRKRLLEAYDALVKSVKKNGHRAGIYEKAPEEEKEEAVKKSYIEIQVDQAIAWLKKPVCKPEQKAVGQQAVRNVVEMARQMSEDLKGSEREELRNAMADTEQLLCDCGKKYDLEKNTLLMDRLKELKKSIRRGVVTRVVEDFIEADAPLTDLDMLADAETDESKRKFILERKIASLLAQLGRVTKTARFVAGASSHQAIGVEITQCSEQTELLAPMLVQAAQQRIDHPDDTVVIEKYKKLLTQYAESISKVRDLCDRAVDPMDFVQTAGDTMQRMREDMAQHNNDAQKCAYSSRAITKLANRVIHVGMSSPAVRNDAELQAALASAQRRLAAATPAPATRVSRLPDWRESTAELLRTAGDVESALGGENIFKREPTTANQPIYSVARSLHESVREWSARDNEIVAVARRMAVLMARLADYMNTDKQQALIATSKSIVLESHEVAELAKKLAHECSDVRIKTNLLQTCERIPTISGQLKMLTTVKGSSLGHQGSEADKEAMDMLVHNAQSLMMSIQEVVKAAAGASVKIMSQRGPRLRWVRKNFY